MPKPNQRRTNVSIDKHENRRVNREKTLLETKPNVIMYADNFITKIIVLFILVFLFAPIMTVVYGIQSQLLRNFQLNFNNVMFYIEIALILCILVVIIKIVLDVLDWYYTVYILTDNRLIIERGFINKETITMPYNRVQDIEVSQSFLERIINVGSLIIYGSSDKSETILDAVPNPSGVEDIILSNINNNMAYPNQYNVPNNNYSQQPTYPNTNQTYNNINPNQNQYYDDETITPEHNEEAEVHYFENNSQQMGNDYVPEQQGPEVVEIEDEDTYGEKFNNKWDNPKKLDKDEIFRKHEAMFKRSKK